MKEAKETLISSRTAIISIFYLFFSTNSHLQEKLGPSQKIGGISTLNS